MSADDAVQADDPVTEDSAVVAEGPGETEVVAEEAPTEEELPILTVRETVIFPGAMLPITVGRPSSVALVQAMGENRLLAVVSQLDPRVETPGPADLYPVGTVCVLHKALRVPKENLLLLWKP
jgi:ATP-dependent Lon protease